MDDLQNLFSIEKTAKAAGVSKTTLKRLDEDGIVVPHKVNPENGYRYYSIYNISEAKKRNLTPCGPGRFIGIVAQYAGIHIPEDSYVSCYVLPLEYL